ncbi:MAG: PqqD family protein [Muribaculaceae bacterium]|nr:PqqD family protein [Muribaculaceae bacterium]
MKLKKDFTLRTVMNQKVLIAEGNNADSFGKIINLNSSAAMLWEELKGKNFEVADAADLLVEKYGIDRTQAIEDATYITNLMAEKGLLEK